MKPCVDGIATKIKPPISWVSIRTYCGIIHKTIPIKMIWTINEIPQGAGPKLPIKVIRGQAAGTSFIPPKIMQVLVEQLVHEIKIGDAGPSNKTHIQRPQPFALKVMAKLMDKK